jgi:uncharacterized membrane protein YgaE (UPF0421/DUF939 family)
VENPLSGAYYPGLPMRRRVLESAFARRGEQLLDAAAHRSRDTMRDRIAGLRGASIPILQTALATGLAWVVAERIVGHEAAFFAPIAAVISLGVSQTQRLVRAIEVVVGVAMGIFVGDLLVLWIGAGGLQIVLVVALAMTAAVIFSGRPLLVSQAATSAVLVVTLMTTPEGLNWERVVDALIGGAAGLAVHALIPGSPVRMARRAAEPVIRELAASLEDVASALEARDPSLAEAALIRARNVEQHLARWHSALRAASETARVAPIRWRSRGVLAPHIGAETHIDRAVGNVQVLARRSLAALATDEPIPDLLIAAIRDLASAVRGVGEELERGESVAAAFEAAQSAAARATLVLDETALSGSTIVAQVRSTAVDLLRGLGFGRAKAQRAVRQAAARAREQSGDPAR